MNIVNIYFQAYDSKMPYGQAQACACTQVEGNLGKGGFAPTNRIGFASIPVVFKLEVCLPPLCQNFRETHLIEKKL